MDSEIQSKNIEIKAVIGLGNPGPKYYHNRHSIGFRIIDALAEKYGTSWRSKKDMEVAHVVINGKNITLIKPQTFMNSSGTVIPTLIKQGIQPENILVIHDELELPFGQIKIKMGGSHKGHNGLKSIIAACGDNFMRLRFGIGRPNHKDDVPTYVLQNFTEGASEIDKCINQAIAMIETLPF